MIKLILFLILVSCKSQNFSVNNKNMLIISHKAFHNTLDEEIFFTSKNKDCVNTARKNVGADFDFAKTNLDKAFRLGADYIEVDTRLTKDGEILVTHDRELDCLTNMKGRVADYTYQELKMNLAPNHKVYFIKNGKKIFPFKNKGVGEVFKLEELIKLYPSKGILINPKDKSDKSFTPYLSLFKKYPTYKFMLWGPYNLYKEALKKKLNISEFINNHHQSKKCLERYRNNQSLDICEGMSMSLSIKDTKTIEGWPKRFLSDMKEKNAKIYIFLPGLSQIEYIKNALKSNISGVIVSDIKKFKETFL